MAAIPDALARVAPRAHMMSDKTANKIDQIATGKTRMMSFSPPPKLIGPLITDHARAMVATIGANAAQIRLKKRIALGPDISANHGLPSSSSGEFSEDHHVRSNIGITGGMERSEIPPSEYMALFCAGLRFIDNDCKFARFLIIWITSNVGIKPLNEKTGLNKLPLKILSRKIL